MSKEKIKKVEIEENDGTFKFFLIIVLIMAILSIGCCVGVIIGYNINKDKEEVEKDNSKKEELVSDVNLINDLAKEVEYYANYVSFPISVTESMHPIMSIYDHDVSMSDISEDSKFLLALRASEAYEISDGQIVPDYVVGPYYKYIVQSDVENNYKKLFGNDLVEHKNYEVSKFEKYYYELDKQMYYKLSAGGNTFSLYPDDYMEKVTSKDNEVYVYVRVGVQGYSTCYTDFHLKNSYECGTAWPMITSDNYVKFSQYKYTFVKNGDNYIFDNVKKVK